MSKRYKYSYGHRRRKWVTDADFEPAIPAEGIKKVRKTKNRFEAFNAHEREILRLLLEHHANQISEIAINLPNRVHIASYVAQIEELEREARG